MATTITTSTASYATEGGRLVATTSDGTIWTAVYDLANTRWTFWYSTNSGTSFAENTNLRQTASSTDACASLVIDANDWMWFPHSRGTSTGLLLYTTSAITTSYAAWDASETMTPSDVTWIDAAVLVTDNYAYALVGLVENNDYALWSGRHQYSNSTFTSNLTYLDTAGLSDGQMAVDFAHTGDGLTVSGTYGLYVYTCYQDSDSTDFRRVAYSFADNNFTIEQTVRTIDSQSATAGDPLTAIFDGSRFLMAFTDDDGDTLPKVYQRDAADTLTTSLPISGSIPALSDGAITSLSLAVPDNGTSGDFRLFAVGTTSDDVKYTDYDRSADTFSAWASVATTTATALTMSAQRGSYNSGVSLVWTSGSGSPYDIVWESSTLNAAPNAPTWLTPADSSAQDETATLPVTWAFDDDDDGDTQSAYAIKRTISAVTTYYNAGAGTWSGTEVKNTSTTEGVTLPATWGADGDEVALYVKTWDAADAEGVYGDALNVTGSVKVNPTITVPADNATLTGPTMTVTWTATADEVTAHRIRILTSADAVLYDTGKVTSTAMTTTLSGYNLANGLVDIKAELRTWNDEGLESSTDTATGVDVTYTAPLTPVLTVTNVDASGYISVAIADPTPSGTPQISYHDVYVRVASGGTQVGERTVNDDGIRIATGVAEDGTYLDYACASGTDFEYRVLGVATTGATAYSAWT